MFCKVLFFSIKVLLAKKVSCYKAEELRCKEFKCYNLRNLSIIQGSIYFGDNWIHESQILLSAVESQRLSSPDQHDLVPSYLLTIFSVPFSCQTVFPLEISSSFIELWDFYVWHICSSDNKKPKMPCAHNRRICMNDWLSLIYNFSCWHFPGFVVYRLFCLGAHMRKLVWVCSGMVKLMFSKIKNFEGPEDFGWRSYLHSIPWNVDSKLWPCVRNINAMEETCMQVYTG